MIDYLKMASIALLGVLIIFALFLYLIHLVIKSDDPFLPAVFTGSGFMLALMIDGVWL